MNTQIWEKTIVAWVNSLRTSTPVGSINEINDAVMLDIIKKVNLDFRNNPVDYLKEAFPHLIDSNSFTLTSSLDYLCATTLLLVYVSFSTKPGMEGLRELMCTHLDNLTQANIAEFLIGLQNYEDVFDLSFKTVRQEIFNFVERQTSQTISIGDGIKTPVKQNISNSSYDSPLQGFFQTPVRNRSDKRSKHLLEMCGDGDYVKLVKKLNSQLAEEELERASLLEKLNVATQKSNDYEMKLRNKIDEINHIKQEWENESKKNENEVKLLKDNISRKIDSEKKLKSELTHLGSYVKTLESDLSTSLSAKNKLEYELKLSLEKCSAYESQLQDISEVNKQLKEAIETKEKELTQMRENYVNYFKDETAIDTSFMNGSLDTSVHPPENMEVVIDVLFKEKMLENATLKENIEELQNEKNRFSNEIKSLNEELESKSSAISELQNLNKELVSKIEKFDLIEQELSKTQKELVNTKEEISKLVKENFQLNEKYNLVNVNLQQRERAFIECKNAKMLLHVAFSKLAEDFKAAQQRLELEVKNISKLGLGNDKNLFKIENQSGLSEVGEFRKIIGKLKDSPTEKDSDHNEKFKLKKEYTPTVEDEKLDKLTQLLCQLDNYHLEWSESRTSMQKTCAQLNDNIISLKIKVNDLENDYKRSVEEKIELENRLREAQERIKDVQTCHSFEINKLKNELEEKQNKIKELESLTRASKKIQENLTLEKEILMDELKELMAKAASAEKRTTRERGVFTDIVSIDFYSKDKEVRDLQKSQEKEELCDSLEEIPIVNKTFDIVNLEEKAISDKTFSIKKDVVVEKSTSTNKSNSVWVVSPPSKIPPKQPVKTKESRRVQGESWVVPLAPVKPKPDKSKKVSSTNDLSVKTDTDKIDTSSTVTKSSSLSSILEIEYSPPSKIDSKASISTTFFSSSESTALNKKESPQSVGNKESSDSHNHKVEPEPVEQCSNQTFMVAEREEEIFDDDVSESEQRKKGVFLKKTILMLRKENIELSKECDRLKLALLESEQKRQEDRKTYDMNQDTLRQNITSKYEAQLEHLKNEMKQLYNRELAKHKTEQSKLNCELREQNKRYREHIDELRNQLWDLGEKLLNEQKLKRDLERNYNELKKKFENMMLYKDTESKNLYASDAFRQKEPLSDESSRTTNSRQIPNASFPTIPTEDEDEVFDNRFLEDMKTGHCKVERPEGRLMELQYRNSLCLPHLKSSYPAETQFHNPTLYKESDLKFGLLPFGQESQSLTDSDHSMTRSLLPENKAKKKDQTSYKKPGPPTPSKNGGRLSIQSGDLRLTPRNVLREINDQNERNKGTPNPLKALFAAKNVKSEITGGKDEVRRWKGYVSLFFLLFGLFGLGAYFFLNQLVLILLL